MNKVFIKDLFNFIIEKNISRHAQSLSFATVLCLVPIFTIFLGVLASSNWFDLAKVQFESFLINNLFPKTISNTFSTYIDVFANKAGSIKTMGLLFFIISILFLLFDMEESFSEVVDSETQKVWYLRFLSIVLIFISPILMFLLLSFANWVGSINIKTLEVIFDVFKSHKILIRLLIAIGLFVWFLFLFKVLPHRKLSWKSLSIGSIIATIAFMLSQRLFGIYLELFATYEVIYGVFSIIPIFLLWIYLNWQITLYSLLVVSFLDNYKSNGKIIG